MLSYIGYYMYISHVFLGKCSFEKSPRHDSYMRKFEAELAQQCEKLVMDLDRKIRRGRERLAQDSAVPMPIPGKIAEQLSAREEQVKKLLEQIEELGEAGKVDEAEALMRRVDILNAEKTALANQADNKVAMLEKKMELCETCGSFLVADDALERTQSHVTGKQHIGYGMVRDFLAEYKAAKEKPRSPGSTSPTTPSAAPATSANAAASCTSTSPTTSSAARWTSPA